MQRLYVIINGLTHFFATLPSGAFLALRTYAIQIRSTKEKKSEKKIKLICIYIKNKASWIRNCL